MLSVHAVPVRFFLVIILNALGNSRKTEVMKKRILITEDDPGGQDIFKIVFEKAGYDVLVNEDGRTLLENNFDNPNLFLLDKQLPGVDGLDICKHLKSHEDTKNIPVIMVSASPGLADMARSAGADDYLEKPFHLKELLATVEKYV
jgi:DNA-binding response OmpR family regulator